MGGSLEREAGVGTSWAELALIIKQNQVKKLTSQMV